jgi:hypothetical protein
MIAGAMAWCLVLPWPASAQTPSLADVARKEAERRKGIKETEKVITNKDLPESARKPKSTPPNTVSPGAAGEQASRAGAGQKPGADSTQKAAPSGAGQKDEKYWKDRIETARETLRRNEAFAEALQSRINALATDFVNRDDPAQRAKIGEDREKALAELARVKTDIEQGRKQVADIEEEARQAGVPPGWLR